MSSVSNIILSIQEKMSTSSNPLEMATLAKVIEKLNLRSVGTVANFASLPTLDTDGNVYLVNSEDELYYNVGNTWTSLGKIAISVAYAWGNNANGRLGDNTTIGRSSPVTVLGGITNWTMLSAAPSTVGHSVGLTSSGTAYAWGCNASGRLGDNTIIARSAPVTVAGGITNWSQVSAGAVHSLGIAGSVAYAWGSNAYGGALGDNTATTKSSPVTVVGGITNWNTIEAGAARSNGLTSDGVAYSWGFNAYGQLGDGTVINRSSPVTVVGGITWDQISGHGYHTLGISNGIAYAWGNNNTGQLGDNTTIGKSSPITVVGGITNWSQVSAGRGVSIGITNGVAYSWGLNGSGQLGDNTTINKASPVTVVGGIINWTSVNADSTSIGIANGVAYAWGLNGSGLLGDNTAINKSSPVTVVGGITTWSNISVRNHVLGISTDIKKYTQ